MAPALTAALPRANIVRSFPRVVLYGPISCQGLGMTDPFLYQYCRHIQDLVDQPWRGTEVGQLLRVNLEAAKMEAGLYGSLFDHPIRVKWFNTTASLILETLRFCQEHNIYFSEPGWTLQPNCKHDRSIMEAMSALDLSITQLQIINRCRLYSQVISLSDISDGRGTHLLLQHMTKPTRWSTLYKYKWPSQGKPTQAEWDIWLTALQSAFTGKGRALEQPLGLWNQNFDSTHPDWSHFIWNNKLYERHGEQWLMFELAQGGNRRFQSFDLQGTLEEHLPHQALPTRAFLTNRSHIATGLRHRVSSDPLPPTFKTFYEALQSFEDKWICTWMKEPEDLHAFTNLLYNNELLGVSDGTCHLKWDLCSAGWILWHKDDEMKGGGTIPGPLTSSTSYRGELGGILGLVLVLLILESISPPPPKYSIKLACDGISALSKSLLTGRQYFTAAHKDFDLISRIISYREKLVATIIPIHVKGHQKGKIKNLTRAALLNDRMDELAKSVNSVTHHDNWDVPDALPPNPHGMIQVDYKEIPISSCLCKSLVDHISTDRLKKYWKSKGRLPPPFAATWVDWKVMKTTMTELSHRMNLFVSKWTTNTIAVGEVMARRSEVEKGLCPCCLQVIETKIHVLRCPRSKTIWRKGCRKLRKWTRSQKTDPQIIEALYDILKYLPQREDYQTYVPLDQDPSIQKCLNAQSHMGWMSFIEGIFSIDWANTQQQYYSTIGSRKTGHRWAVGLSTQLWRLIFKMWDNRNKILHETEAANKVYGLDIVQTAIITELQQGPDTLDMIYHSYFKINLKSVKKMTSVDARNWLTLIRRARNVQGYQYNDYISRTPALQKWIGLRKSAKKAHLRFSRTGYNPG